MVVLRETPFHPQGGGQPADHGRVEGRAGALVVEDVRVADGDVLHKGRLEGTLQQGDEVAARVDEARRHRMSRLHSAGHVVDMAIAALGWTWVPGKGYHFPDGPYVEYRGSLDGRGADEVAAEIEAEARRITTEGCPVTLRFVRADSGDAALRFMPPGMAGDDEIRVVEYGSFAVPCGGTHVKNLSDVDGLTIRKVREKSGVVRVSYALGTAQEPAE